MPPLSPPKPVFPFAPAAVANTPVRIRGQTPSPAVSGRRILRALGWIALVSVAMTSSAFVHLATPTGRAAATSIAEGIMNTRIRGVSHIGAITRLDFDGVEMKDLTVTAPDGEQVISADRMRAEFAFLDSLTRGALVLTPCELEGGTMVVSRGPDDQINLVHTLEVPDDRFMIPVQIRDIRLLHQTMVFHLPPIPVSVQMANVYGLVDMELGHQFSARMDQVHGYVNIPVVHIGFMGLNGRILSDDARPLIVRMMLDLDVADPSMRIAYSAPRAIGRDGGGHMTVELGADVPNPPDYATRRTAD